MTQTCAEYVEVSSFVSFVCLLIRRHEDIQVAQSLTAWKATGDRHYLFYLTTPTGRSCLVVYRAVERTAFNNL